MHAAAKLCLVCVGALLSGQPALATETFICSDGRTVKVDSANREKMLQDPCVKAWFEASAVVPVAATGRGIGGNAVRMTRAGHKH